MSGVLQGALTAGLEVIDRLPGASNATFLARGGDTLLIYKPTAGVRPLWDFEASTLATRETLAFEVSEMMNLGVVPETAEAVGPMGPGAVQAFVEADPASQIAATDHRLWAIAALDLVLNNADRKAGHILVAGDRVMGVDHGLTFHPEPKLRTVLWGFAGISLPLELVAAVERLLAAFDGGFGAEMAHRLDEAASRSLRLRVEEVLEHPVHPDPPTDRSAVPWPPY